MNGLGGTMKSSQPCDLVRAQGFLMVQHLILDHRPALPALKRNPLAGPPVQVTAEVSCSSLVLPIKKQVGEKKISLDFH